MDLPDYHFPIKEMVPVVAAAVVWGMSWQGLSIRFHSDNSVVVALLNSGSVRDEALMHLMRCLAFLVARYNFIFSSSHIISGQDNGLADFYPHTECLALKLTLRKWRYSYQQINLHSQANGVKSCAFREAYSAGH